MLSASLNKTFPFLSFLPYLGRHSAPPCATCVDSFPGLGARRQSRGEDRGSTLAADCASGGSGPGGTSWSHRGVQNTLREIHTEN